MKLIASLATTATRVLSTDTIENPQLQELQPQESLSVILKYAILSHTWEEKEVAFEKLGTLAAREKPGLRKIEHFYRQAATYAYDFAWE